MERGSGVSATSGRIKMTQLVSGRRSLDDLINSASRQTSDAGLRDLKMTPSPFRDVMAQCPKCKAVETLQFSGEKLMPCRKFRQIDGEVYHDCGSEQPCRLHR